MILNNKNKEHMGPIPEKALGSQILCKTKAPIECNNILGPKVFPYIHWSYLLSRGMLLPF